MDDQEAAIGFVGPRLFSFCQAALLFHVKASPRLCCFLLRPDLSTLSCFLLVTEIGLLLCPI